jgi:hypothetical protein
MRISYFIMFLLIFCITPQFVYAHEGHWDQLGLDEVIDEAKLEIKQLVTNKQLSESWTQAKFNYDLTDGLIEIEGKRRWVLAYDNPLEKDPSKQTIKIVFTPLGKFIGFEFMKKE